MTTIANSYLICATPRSGSWLLCEALVNTSLAGMPGEYFWKGDEPGWYERWRVSTYQDYVAQAIQQGSTGNGVFGAKIMMGYFEDFVTKLRATPQYHGRNVPVTQLLSETFPNLHYIWITRSNKVRQAVSFERAVQSGVWADNSGAPIDETKLSYRYEAIDFHFQQFTLYDAGWQEFFSENRISPFTVVYEDLVRNYEHTALEILDYLGISHPTTINFNERRMRKQANSHSEEWVSRYIEEKQKRTNMKLGYPFE